jgi:hypothetical protein
LNIVGIQEGIRIVVEVHIGPSVRNRQGDLRRAAAAVVLANHHP